MSDERNMTYIGTDWRTALERNVTVSLEFAEYDLQTEPPNVERAALFIGEAMQECRRLLTIRPLATPTE